MAGEDPEPIFLKGFELRTVQPVDSHSYVLQLQADTRTATFYASRSQETAIVSCREPTNAVDIFVIYLFTTNFNIITSIHA
jgi:hypothetical protein